MAKDWAVPRYIQKVSSLGKLNFQGRKYLFPTLETLLSKSGKKLSPREVTL
jgi:hypothetical protein